MFGVRYRYVFIAALSVYSYVNIWYTVGDKLFDFPIPQLNVFLALALVVIGIWELNRLVERNLERITQVFNKRIHPLILLFAFSLIHVALVCFIVMEALYAVLQMPVQLNAAHLTLLMAFGFRVNLFLNCVNAIVFFMNKLKRTQLEAEQLKKVSIEARFEALRNQINPHFLFNSFNVLSTLVYKDQDTAARFIEQLSSVYRYLLYNQDRKVVPLKDELAFIESYTYLLKIRFGENLAVQNEIKQKEEHLYVAPAVLQMLIENAIKHNVVSRKNPLQILLRLQNGAIEVTNNLQEKEVKEESTQTGLKNIRDRYVFLSDKQVVIEKSDTQFTVKIPLLEFAQ